MRLLTESAFIVFAPFSIAKNKTRNSSRESVSLLEGVTEALQLLLGTSCRSSCYTVRARAILYWGLFIA